MLVTTLNSPLEYRGQTELTAGMISALSPDLTPILKNSNQ